MKKKKNLGFKASRAFFVEMKHYAIQNYLKINGELPHIALLCYNECEIEFFCMKWLIVDRLTEARLIPL